MVGVIIGVLSLTGSASTFASFIVRIGEQSLFLSLVLTMLTCLVLGMGIPTIPNYIITSSIAGPALLELGVPLLVSHMFVFYFGILADLTPPVALAAFAAAPIAKESGMKIGMQAVKIALAGFVIPYMAVYTPALMMQSGGPLEAAIGFWPAVLYMTFKTVFSITLWGAAAIGFLFAPLNWVERIVRDGRRLHRRARLAGDRRGRLRARLCSDRLSLVARTGRAQHGAGRMNLCIEAAGAIVALALQSFTLSWQHSVEKIEWSESWAVSDAGLVLEEASVQGTGAGMEIPEGAVLRDGAWHYRPGLPPLPELVLSDAGRGADWTLVRAGRPVPAAFRDRPGLRCGHPPFTLHPRRKRTLTMRGKTMPCWQ